MGLDQAVLQGDRLALARLLSQVENGLPEGRAAADALFLQSGKAHLVGITGPSGAGKSSLVNQLAREIRRPSQGDAQRSVAVICVDPTSPFSGGALLGDRIRMRDLAGDPGVFIRSMASRGALGGLSRSTAEVAAVLDAAGFEIILIETIGAGQSEVDIAMLAHTTIVVEAPGLGDDIQANKAGILEIADILVVNKADLPGAENAVRTLSDALRLGYAEAQTGGWTPPLLQTVATTGSGIAGLAGAIDSHRQHLQQGGLWQSREQNRLARMLGMYLQAELYSRFQQSLSQEVFQAVYDRLFNRSISPAQAALELLGKGLVK